MYDVLRRVRPIEYGLLPNDRLIARGVDLKQIIGALIGKRVWHGKLNADKACVFNGGKGDGPYRLSEAPEFDTLRRHGIQILLSIRGEPVVCGVGVGIESRTLVRDGEEQYHAGRSNEDKLLKSVIFRAADSGRHEGESIGEEMGVGSSGHVEAAEWCLTGRIGGATARSQVF